MNGYEFNNNRSIKGFEEKVLPLLKKIDISFKDCIYLRMEKRKDVNMKKADTKYGIDYLLILHNGNKIGISQRIQWDHDYRSFTIRANTHTGWKTELHKRYQEYENNNFKIDYIIQSYIINNRVISIGMIRPKNLYDFHKKYPKEVKRYKNSQDYNEFDVIYWHSLKKHKYPLRLYDIKNDKERKNINQLEIDNFLNGIKNGL